MDKKSRTTKTITLPLSVWRTIYQEVNTSICGLGYQDGEEPEEVVKWVNERIDAMDKLGVKLGYKKQGHKLK